MGNTQNKSAQQRNIKSTHSSRDGQAFSSQFSLSHFVGNLSGRSFVSVTSNQSVYSASRPWSRVSRRRWNESTLKNPLEGSKTAWPVAHKESIFLPEFPITTVLHKNDFQIDETIAKGAFGQVYKVNKVTEDKHFALKVLSKAQVVGDNAVRQVKEEARIQEACGHHTFIAGAVSRWQTKKRLYIVSEYIPCGELLALLQQYTIFPEELVKIFVAEIASALDFLHNAGVIYRDLKPENVLLNNDYHIKLIDFGLSKWLSVGARTTTLCGTLQYMAPEVLSREPYGHAVDWWSLGVLTCRMLTNQHHKRIAKRNTAAGVNELLKKANSHDIGAGSFSGSEDGAGRKHRWSRKVVMGTPKFPAPAVGARANSHTEDTDDDENDVITQMQPVPGSLPKGANISKPARGLLTRLLERDPRVRMKNLRQLQQSAFYLGYNFDHVKTLKISPKTILDRHFPDGPPCNAERQREDKHFDRF